MDKHCTIAAQGVPGKIPLPAELYMCATKLPSSFSDPQEVGTAGESLEDQK